MPSNKPHSTMLSNATMRTLGAAIVIALACVNIFAATRNISYGIDCDSPSTSMPNDVIQGAMQSSSMKALLSLESTAYTLSNPGPGFSLVGDRGVVAGTCTDAGWDYVLSYTQDDRTSKWDAQAAISHRKPGEATRFCGYGYDEYFSGASVNGSHVMVSLEVVCTSLRLKVVFFGHTNQQTTRCYYFSFLS